jgi:6-pyruvoyltetrahydropterin/6-carboxytetrahydropterin synthase
VSVTGSIDQGSGWLVDLKKLGQIVKNNVVNILDHSQIEEGIAWFKGKQPSSENILIWAWNEIAPRMEQGTLHRLRLVETHSIYTDYYGPEQ